jgi:hypothetical protein
VATRRLHAPKNVTTSQCCRRPLAWGAWCR